MKSIAIASLLSVLLAGCTVYKSEGRKQFESEGAGKLASAQAATAGIMAQANDNFQLISCKKENSLETWFNEEFPSVNYELVVMETDLEIWRTHRGQTVEIKALQRSQNATHSCIYHFSSDIVWNLYKNQFVKELENNLMTLD